jgi:ubiquinone/menaquinone biosynthesis C-methylase UbiE
VSAVADAGEDRQVQDVAACCADFYSSEAVRLLLGDSLHPGGEELTRELLEMAGAAAGRALLDVGGGVGVSAVLAARECGCEVSVVDRSTANLELASRRVDEAGLAAQVTLAEADVHALPFADGSFDVVLCECVLSTFTDKPAAVAELRRVLRGGGRLAISDVTLETEALPPELSTLLARVACLADAPSLDALRELLSRAGLATIVVRDAGWALTEMARRVRRRLIAARVAGQIGALDTSSFDLDEGKRLADRAVELIEAGDVGYVTLVATPEVGT